METRLLGRGAAVFGVLMVLMVVVGASPASAAVELEVEPATRVESGTPATFVVDITADQATSGTLSVEMENLRVYREQVEVPGGSTKRFVLVSATLPWMSQARVVFEESNGERKVATVAAVVPDDPASWTPAAGVFPSLVDDETPTSIETTVEGLRTDLLPVDPALLSEGAVVLAPLGTVIMTEVDASALGDDEAAALIEWVASGGQIVYSGSPLALPEALQPSNGATAWVGDGAVRGTDGLTSATLDGVVTPDPGFSLVAWQGEWREPSATTRSIAQDAGVSLLGINPIALFLLAYALVVGPVLWLALRSRGRSPLYWLAAPGVALIATVGIWLVGRVAQSGSNAAFAALVIDENGLSTTIRSANVVLSPTGGYAGVELTSGWRPIPDFDDVWMNGVGQGPVPEVTGDRYGLDLPAGGISLLETAISSPGTTTTWEVTVSGIDANRVEGTVANVSDRSLQAVAIGIGEEAILLGDLEPGQSETFSLELPAIAPAAQEVWPGDVGWGRLMDEAEQDQAPVNPGLFDDWRFDADLSESMLVVVGWTDELPTPIGLVDDSSALAGRTGLIATRSLYDVAEDDVRDQLPARGLALSKQFVGEFGVAPVVDQPGVAQLVMGPASDGHPEPSGSSTVDPEDESSEPDDQWWDEERLVGTYRFEISPDAPLDGQLALEAGDLMGLDYWDGERWVPSGLASAEESGMPELWAVPPSAIRDGIVLLRAEETWESTGIRMRRSAPDEVLAWTVGE